MKISYNWLKEFIDFNWSVKELAGKLTFAGIEIEGIEDLPSGDFQLDLEITPNRPDCLSFLGLAREIRALNGGSIKVPPTQVSEAGADVNSLAKVEVEDQQGCPRYLARVVTGVNVAESPDWLKKKIESIGLRPSNNVADITNLALYEFGHPLHAFDLDKLSGHKIVVRRAKQSELMVTLDGAERKLTPEYLVIADAQKPAAIAGIMGGLESEISSATKNVLLESAYFDPPLIRRGSKNLGLKSDASYRFERGADPNILEQAVNRAARLISEIAGGQIAKGIIDVSAKKFPAGWELELRPEKTCQLLGTGIKPEKMVEILNALELKASISGNVIKVQVPSFRADLTREADLIEEIGRIYGYDNLPDEGIKPWPVPGLRRPKEAAVEKIVEAMVSLGFCQHYGLPLMDPAYYAKLGMAQDGGNMVELDNSLSSDLSALRPMLLPGLLEAGQRNLNNGLNTLRLFECGLAFAPGKQAPVESLKLGMLACGESENRSWDRKPELFDFFDLKGALENLFAALKIKGISYSPDFKSPKPFLHPGRSVELLLDGAVIGWAGELDAAVLKTLDIKEKLYCSEMDLEQIMKLMERAVAQFSEIPKYPAVKRDLAIMVPQQISSRDILNVITETGGATLERAELFDLYSGGQIEKGQKSLAFSLAYRHPERTLTDAEVNQVHQEIVEELKEKFGAEIR
ncbi:phenylalanine--tRNA ligase subunit beta [candidate division TA06 bacterium]|uniref:Phenylalanine--tRNA ligase beta subunit n=1 Tax=candidate division TA06 bacterium TaxID=2250710 RepID=A0A933IC81_UNCT6|nr:phenylalanine--tRNA ligase subunit beta [candidate division TA06 bacterium]